MINAPADPAQVALRDVALRDDTVRSARLFLAQTASVIHPGLSARTLLRYLSQYRAHLAAVVAADRHAVGHASHPPDQA